MTKILPKLLRILLIAIFFCSNTNSFAQLSKETSTSTATNYFHTNKHLAAGSLFEWIEAHNNNTKTENTNIIKLKTEALDSFLRDPETRKYIFSKQTDGKFPPMPAWLENLVADFFYIQKNETFQHDINTSTIKIVLNGHAVTLTFFNNLESIVPDSKIGLLDKDLTLAKTRGYWIEAIYDPFEKPNKIKEGWDKIPVTDLLYLIDTDTPKEGWPPYHSITERLHYFAFERNDTETCKTLLILIAERIKLLLQNSDNENSKMPALQRIQQIIQQALNGESTYQEVVSYLEQLESFVKKTYDYASKPSTSMRQTIMYEIMPDRFVADRTAKNSVGKLRSILTGLTQPKAEQEFDPYTPAGGTLKNITEKLDYLSELGINAIYLTPIFEALSYHGYTTVSFFDIDPNLGTLDDFKELIQKAHSKNIKIVLDAVCNHTSCAFFAFTDIQKNGPKSQYKDWYDIEFQYDTNGNILRDSDGNAVFTYKCWENITSLPKLNLNNPEVQNYLLKVLKYWTNMGVDGWRFDSTHYISAQNIFWNTCRAELRSINPNIFLYGETLIDGEKASQGMYEHGPSARWSRCFKLDGYQDNALYAWILKYLQNRFTAEDFSNEYHNYYDCLTNDEVRNIVNFLGGHDTRRALQEILQAVKSPEYSPDRENELYGLFDIALGLLFLSPGIPMLYYGDETGTLTGFQSESTYEDGSRVPMNWKKKDWDQTIFDLHKKWIEIRKAFPALQTGNVRLLTKNGALIFICEPKEPTEDPIIGIINRNNYDINLDINISDLKLENIAALKKLTLCEDTKELLGEKISSDSQRLNITSSRWSTQVYRATKNQNMVRRKISENNIVSDIEHLKVLADSIAAYTNTDNRVYEIKYNISKLSQAQQDLIKAYIALLNNKMSRPNTIIGQPFTGTERGYLIKAVCKKDSKEIVGEGEINIFGEESAEGYPLRLIGMLNIAIAVSNIPQNAKERQLDDYESIIEFVKSQYQSITGLEFAHQNSLKELVNLMRKIILPRPEKISIDDACILNKLASQLLTSA
jgi:glycosidase